MSGHEKGVGRIDAAAAWLMSDDSAYAAQPDQALRAAKEMLDAADLADEESIGPRLAAARDRAIATLDGDEHPHPLDGLLEPGARNFDPAVSIAISLKRIADHLAPTNGDMPPLLWLGDVIRELKS